MRILFAISILALLALLWASIAMAQYIRRARRRRRRFLEATDRRSANAAIPARLGITELVPLHVPELTFTDLEAPASPAAETVITEPVPTPLEDRFPVVHQAINAQPAQHEPAFPEPEPEITLAAEEQLEEEAQSETIAEPVAAEAEVIPEPALAHPVEPIAFEPEITEAAEEQLEAEQEPEPEPVRAVAPPPAPRPPRPFRATPPKHPLATLIPPIHRPDWVYFNKDMGDLSDPAPRAPRIRPHNND